ncbi:hypothetical protein Pelo_11698 [Pelomyxa schiedti]|nr:hypothetical protein Pelo_11698 [Pelomyxa schiedti]
MSRREPERRQRENQRARARERCLTEDAALVIDTDPAFSTWPIATVRNLTYFIHQGTTNCSAEAFSQACAKWESVCGVAFKPVTTVQEAMFDIRDASLYEETQTPGLAVSVFAHELGHILGWRHEHIRDADAATNRGEAHTPTCVDVTPYDRNSIMHYDKILGARAVYGAPIRFSQRSMSIEEAKTLWAQDPNVDRVQVHPCPCQWRPAGGAPHPCPLKSSISTPTMLYTRVQLSQVPSTCCITPSFRRDTLCPKTGCDNGGTQGGWCATIMPDGTYHCLHCWCHRRPHFTGAFEPCTKTVHQCTVWVRL